MTLSSYYFKLKNLEKMDATVVQTPKQEVGRILTHLPDDCSLEDICGRVYIPARSVCLECYEDMKEWVEVSKRGVLETYTIVYQQSPIVPFDTPFTMGVIKLDGADTGLVHRVAEVDLAQIRIGMRVEAVFADSPKGDIRDILYFKPVD